MALQRQGRLATSGWLPAPLLEPCEPVQASPRVIKGYVVDRKNTKGNLLAMDPISRGARFRTRFESRFSRRLINGIGQAISCNGRQGPQAIGITMT
jgi:hypothetical protein